MTVVDLSSAKWRKSSISEGNGGDCVEVAKLANGVGVRDSKSPDGPVLVFSLSEWTAFTDGVCAGEFKMD